MILTTHIAYAISWPSSLAAALSTQMRRQLSTVSAVVQVLLTYEELRLFVSVSALEDGAESKLVRKICFSRISVAASVKSLTNFLRGRLPVLCKILTCLLASRREVEVSYSLEVRQSAVLQFFYLSQSEKNQNPWGTAEFLGKLLA